MNNNRVWMYTFIAAAVIAAAVAAIIVTSNRATIARERRATAESQAATAESEQRKASADQKTAEAKARESANAAKKAEADKVAAAENAKAEKSRAEAEKNAAAAAKADADRARDEARAQADRQATAKAEADKAKAETEAVKIALAAEVAKSNAVAQAAADALAAERLRSEKVIAEATLLENRRIDFETWQARLNEREYEIAERERALTPEMTTSDLQWAPDSELKTIDGEEGPSDISRKRKILPENDPSLPEATRRLAKIEREMRETLESGESAASNKVVKALTRLYVEAVRDGRTVDADYYRRSIKHYYPNWKYTP